MQELYLQIEQLNDEVKHLTGTNKQLKKLLKEDPYGGATQVHGDEANVHVHVHVNVHCHDT